jgi:Ca2+-binding RTX toxin-like protein
MLTPHHRNSSHRDAARLLCVEPLEDRLALSVSLRDGVLSIVGTKKNDNVTVTQSAGILNINLNGAVTPVGAAVVRQIEVAGGRGNDRITIGPEITLRARIWGGNGKDNIRGGGGDDILFGENQDDVLIGGGGQDWLDGGRQNDILVGDGGVDSLMGANGRDTLSGGPDQDFLTGGNGKDTFSGTEAIDTARDLNTRQDSLFGQQPVGATPPPVTPPVVPPGQGLLPAVTPGPFDAPGLLGTRTDLVAGAPAITQTHVEGPVDYTGYSNPPTYGPHHAVSMAPHFAPLQPTGVYTTEQEDEDAVHNLEHGHVWISYNPTLIGANLTPLQELVRSFGVSVGVVLTPRADNDTMIALASWAHLQTMTTFDPIAIRNFAITNRGHAPEGFITP